ncbi:hypothetical protein B7P43_G16929 [Cryptotermes secundus]|uniref:Uncharacterized protein n=1 Tax=Cryptotermes secundus TaxID=105785 RepID=A0A2J7PYD8_9NEOP|nr:hypothetical protein B7P43_G16929 [Cryptotermes secundus]
MLVEASRVAISYGRPALFYNVIPKKTEAIGCLLRVKSPGKTWNSEENVSRIKEPFQRSPRKSIHAASLQLQIPRSTLHNVLDKSLAPPRSIG